MSASRQRTRALIRSGQAGPRREIYIAILSHSVKNPPHADLPRTPMMNFLRAVWVIQAFGRAMDAAGWIRRARLHGM
jgi:hypothetical protein